MFAIISKPIAKASSTVKVIATTEVRLKEGAIRATIKEGLVNKMFATKVTTKEIVVKEVMALVKD